MRLLANAEDLSFIPGVGRSLEKEMVMHSSIFAWEIQRTEEPDGVPSVGYHPWGRKTVGHSLASKQ